MAPLRRRASPPSSSATSPTGSSRSAGRAAPSPPMTSASSASRPRSDPTRRTLHLVGVQTFADGTTKVWKTPVVEVAKESTGSGVTPAPAASAAAALGLAAVGARDQLQEAPLKRWALLARAPARGRLPGDRAGPRQPAADRPGRGLGRRDRARADRPALRPAGARRREHGDERPGRRRDGVAGAHRSPATCGRWSFRCARASRTATTPFAGASSRPTATSSRASSRSDSARAGRRPRRPRCRRRRSTGRS